MSHANRSSRKLAAVAAALALVAAACSSATGADDSAAVRASSVASRGEPAPATAFVTFDGVHATLADFAGQPLVVNFWASWCPSCVAEMSAAFRPVHASLGERVTFLGMNIQDDRSSALDLLEETGVEWINAEDPRGDVYRELGGLGMPFTVFITADGEIVERHNGPLSEQQLRDKITEELHV
jgi:thiol-disulfide isomerase/thioredoxin